MKRVDEESQIDPKLSDISAVRFARKGQFVTRTTAGEAVIVPVRGQVGDLDSIYTFNEVGAFIWSLLDGRTSVGDIVQAIGEKFDGALEHSKGDAVQFLGTLESWGIIEPSVEKDS
jgi:hypothetical protein